MRPIADIRRWASAVPDIGARLRNGARVAVIECGRGELAIALAVEFPATLVAGFDHRHREITIARMAAAVSGVSDRVTFEVAAPADVRGVAYDVIWWATGTRDSG